MFLLSKQPNPDLNRLRAALLPDLLLSIVGPFLIYRLAAPQMGALIALLLAGVLPLIRVGISFTRSHRLNMLGALSLLTIALQLFVTVVFKDARMLLVGNSLTTACYGILLLASLLTSKPLLMRLIESVLANHPSDQSQQIMSRWQEAGTRASFTIITAVWGIGSLLEFGVCLILAFTLSIDRFLVISPLIHYGFLGLLLIWAFLFGRLRRRQQAKHRPGEPLPQAPEPTGSTASR
ncbi:MAG: VC0807 family protein [Ktedonobacteraceae bacterium]